MLVSPFLRRVQRSLVVVGVLAASSGVRAGSPDENRSCVASYEQAQRERRDNHLRAAASQLEACLREVCPSVLRHDCAGWKKENQAALPTVLLRARFEGGQPSGPVRIIRDGELVPRLSADGSIELDPGYHVLRAEAVGFEPAEARLLAREGEKQRVVELTLRPAAVNALQPLPVNPGAPIGTQPKVAPSRALKVPTVAYPIAAAGALALVAGSAFAIAGLSQKSDLARCKPTCDPNDVDAANQKFLFADLGFLLGLGALGAATYLTLHENLAGEGAARIGLVVTPRGARTAFSLEF